MGLGELQRVDDVNVDLRLEGPVILDLELAARKASRDGNPHPHSTTAELQRFSLSFIMIM